MIEIIHLQIIQTVYNQGTLTKASETLNLTQPALSHAIKKLEGQLGLPLWTKEGRNLRLSQGGLLLKELADQILPQVTHSEELLKQISQGKRGVLRIGMECHPCYKWLVKVVDPYLQVWPDVDLDVRQEFQFDGLRALKDNDIDLLVTPDPVLSDELESYSIFDYELLLALSINHPLASKAYIEPEDLQKEILITYPVGKEKLDVYTQFLLPAYRNPKQFKTIETTDIMLQMVNAGRGLTTLPDWLIEEYKDTLSIKGLPLGSMGIHKSLFIIKKKSTPNKDYIRSFIEIARNHRMQKE
ncbi:LysR family transcriptional regulator [Spirochaeta cellobiosiphila]|uniref:LysR family transcriptional regulator n=1 Tax=Spirochaeta cellobiosiphila TaxID=504483 RepID=UPI00041F803F|nr:LysR family transcriptional regulator [Spirochaeta cellobiosiphila]